MQFTKTHLAGCNYNEKALILLRLRPGRQLCYFALS